MAGTAKSPAQATNLSTPCIAVSHVAATSKAISYGLSSGGRYEKESHADGHTHHCCECDNRICAPLGGSALRRQQDHQDRRPNRLVHVPQPSFGADCRGAGSARSHASLGCCMECCERVGAAEHHARE